DTANVYYGAFSCTWSQLKIYVPENAYNTYISFNEYQYKRGQISQYNWWKHKASIVAHNYSN
ncbi:MAG: hypothetical protein IKM03_05865, partial [Alistipes sp.]|nr:hypothetical protein [Alistipes sp.]